MYQLKRQSDPDQPDCGALKASAGTHSAPFLCGARGYDGHLQGWVAIPPVAATSVRQTTRSARESYSASSVFLTTSSPARILLREPHRGCFLSPNHEPAEGGNYAPLYGGRPPNTLNKAGALSLVRYDRRSLIGRTPVPTGDVGSYPTGDITTNSSLPSGVSRTVYPRRKAQKRPDAAPVGNQTRLRLKNDQRTTGQGTPGLYPAAAVGRIPKRSVPRNPSNGADRLGLRSGAFL